MTGNIYTDQKCPVCNGKMVNDANRRGCFCKKHPKVVATERFRVSFGRDIMKRFPTYELAENFLNGVRYETYRGTFDKRDYCAGTPLGLDTLSQKWLKIKATEVKPSTLANLTRYIGKAVAKFGNANIKEIQAIDLEYFLKVHLSEAGLSSKSRHDCKSCLNQFFTWLVATKTIRQDECPALPEMSFELGWRNIVNKETQQAILEEIERITPHNPRIHLAFLFMTTYVDLRPVDIRNIKERDVDLNSGRLTIPRASKNRGRSKHIPLLQEDIDAIKAMPKGFPDQHLFRHEESEFHGAKVGHGFGLRILYKWWKKACANLKIYDVDLYGGCRHSSVTAMGEHATPEDIKKATEHSTNTAFSRYFQPDMETKKEIFRLARGVKHVSNIYGPGQKTKAVK
ncbi:MAG: hypothetical protein JEZ02_05835 [Desulfatibacillum sp.]|nr:hypothetical protein [Desulfatibacillum sp.]